MPNNRSKNSELLKTFLENTKYDFDKLQTVQLLLAALLIDAVKKDEVSILSDTSLYSQAVDICRNSKTYLRSSDLLRFVNDAALTEAERFDIANQAIALLSTDRNYSDISTPVELINVVCKLLTPQPGSSFLDLGSGNGVVMSAMCECKNQNHITKMNITGIEINESMAFISKVLLELQGCTVSIQKGNLFNTTFEEKYDLEYAFPPMGIKYPDRIIDSFNADYRNIFKKSSSNGWYYIFRALESLAPNGRMVALLPEGALFRNSDELIRKNLLERGILESVIALPKFIFEAMSLRCYLLVFSNAIHHTSFKMIDATSCILQEKNHFSRVNIIDSTKLLDLYYSDDAKTVEYQDAAKCDYNLTLPVYFNVDAIKSIDCPDKISNISSVIVGSQYTISHFEPYFSKEATKYQVLTSGNIENGRINFDSLQYVVPDKNIQKLEKFALQENDLVITTKSTIVKIAVVNGLPDRFVIVTGGMLIVRPDLSKIDPVYLKMFFDSETGKTILRSIQKGTIITTIPTSAFQELTVACPPLEKQKKLVRKYSAMLDMYSALNQQLEVLKQQISTLYDDSSQED